MRAQGTSFSSPLSNLADPRPGRAMHEGSWDRKHHNGDSIPLKPGETVTLFEHDGPGCVHRFWVTIAPRLDVAILSQVVIRMYWDGDANPSVECPIGAFFGVGFGEQKDYTSLPLNENSGGYNCYWPMPFHKSARWTLTNGSAKLLENFYYNIDYTALDSLPPATRHFHAQFRRENPTTPGKNYTILETTGEGHYVGTALFMTGLTMGFLEGNEMVYIDGDTKPTIEGTGTEDYFCSGWYFDRGLYSAPYHGVVIKDEKHPRVSAYRWHIEDAIPFSKSIRFTIEHGAQDTVSADYSSVAYYYLAGPSPTPPPLPAELLPSHWEFPTKYAIVGAVEAEDLASSAKATNGGVWGHDMLGGGEGVIWSNASVLSWYPNELNAELNLQVPCHADGDYHLIARMVSGPDSATVQFVLGGKPVGDPVDLYAPTAVPKDVSLGSLSLKAGDVPIAIRVTGRNHASSGLVVGVDAFEFRPLQ
ncbi:MAG TPA: glycoside hydrolase family 172 protein [Opitutaceae bacterium]